MTSVAPSVAGARRLVLARHGRTGWNAAGRYQGHADIGLDAEGLRQATALAAELAALEPERVVTSDLRRARQTAEPLAALLGLEAVVDARLREVDVGAWEGMTPEEASAGFADDYRAWRAGHDVARGGGETPDEAGARAAGALVEHTAAVAPGGVLVAVSHGMVIGGALRRLGVGGRPHLGNAEWLELQVTL